MVFERDRLSAVFANSSSLFDHAETLQATLDEEKHADQLLSRIAQGTNSAASVAA